MSFASMWDSAAKEDVKRFDKIPDGEYMAKIMKCEFGKTKDGSKSKVHWDLQVVEGDHKNAHIWIDRAFHENDESEENKKAITRATDDFKLLGMPADSASIGNSMASLIGKTVEIELKSGNNSQFKNFKRIIDDPAADVPFKKDNPF